MKLLTTTICFICFLPMFFFMTGLITAEGEDINPLIDTNLMVETSISGTIEETGTFFEITDSNYLNITLVSSEPIQVRMESIPEVVTIQIEASEGAASTQIVLSGFTPDTTYYKYQDSYHNLEELTMDTEGACTYTQDLSEPHLVFIQSTKSTIFLSDTGWSDSSGNDPGVGTWDSSTLTGTLITDVYETIQIDSHNITLDGNGHKVSGSGFTGIFFPERVGVTVKNVNIQQFNYGFFLRNSVNCTLTNNTTSNNSRGIWLGQSHYNTLTGNLSAWSSYGIEFYKSNNNNLTENTIERTSVAGMYFEYSSYNTLTGNTVSNNFEDGIYLKAGSYANTLTDNTTNSNRENGIYLFQSSENTLKNNTASDNYFGILICVSSSNILKGNIASNNVHGIGIASQCTDSILTNNTASNNEYIGINLSICPTTTLTGNITCSNNKGIVVGSGSEGSLLEYNKANSNVVGIEIRSTYVTLTCNTVNYNEWRGIYINGGTANPIGNSSHTTMTGNTASFNENIGIYVFNSWACILMDNTVAENSSYGMAFEYWYTNNNKNLVHNNNFINNTTQVFSNGTATIFNTNDGGNYWSNWCPPEHPDTNGDGFVDEPYDFGSGFDNLPLANQVPSTCNTPPKATITGPASGSIHALADGILLEGSIDDPDIDIGDTHTALWSISNEDWIEDFELEGTVTGTSVSDMPYFPEPGIYNIALTVTDSKGASDTTTTVNNQEDMPAFVVIYDTDGGFVTGGGWIWSPAGAYLTDETLEGKANFGFVSKYKKGATIPTGSTEFQFQAGNLDFHSSSYDWLVVTGSNYARFKGTGTINGSGEYKFHIWAGDDSPDTFRIKIWTEDQFGFESIVYDNGFDQAIGGGSIVIHK